MYERLLRHHVLANLSFGLVLVLGLMAFVQLPRQQDPEINFNWVQITTILPGAASEDIEKRVTDPLEEAVRRVSDIRFVASTSRQGISNILIRFEQTDAATFDKRVNDLRREVQNKADTELPPEAETPLFFEVTSANAFPTAMLLVVGEADDETLRQAAYNIQKDLERLPGVDRAQDIGLYDPELHVHFHPERLSGLGLTPVQLADTVAAHFRDTAAGSLRLAEREWLLRLSGTDVDPGRIAALPIPGGTGEVRVQDVATVTRGRQQPAEAVRYEGRPAVLLTLTKKPRASTLELVARVRDYLEERNRLAADTGVTLVLLDDSTVPTRQALAVMQTNALLGLALVLAVTWLFLGSRIAFFTSMGIPFSLAGTFLFLSVIGQTLNSSVLIGTVIVLGMLVDDAVVVVESIYQRLVAGMRVLRAAKEAVAEVAAPVLSAVLTTMAAFLPLMLLPGILGDFMLVIPLVVTVALAVSLLEAFWMLPTHLVAIRAGFTRPSRIHRYRVRLTRRVQVLYVRALVRVLRRPILSLGLVLALLAASMAAVGGGLVRMQFFAFDTLRLFYVNVEMPPGTALDRTLDTLHAVEARVRAGVRPGEVRAMAAYAGQMFTETEPLFGKHLGQIFVSLEPQDGSLREVEAMIEDLRPAVESVAGARSISFTRLTGGPPVSKAIKVKVRGDDFGEIETVAEALKRFLATVPGVKDIGDDANPGAMELYMRLNLDAVHRAGLHPGTVARSLQMLGDGEVVSSFQHQGQKVEVRVRAQPAPVDDLQHLLRHTLALPAGGEAALGTLVDARTQVGRETIRHHNHRRAITVEADLDRALMDTLSANRLLMEYWRSLAPRHPAIDLDFSGELDDIQESLDALPFLFLLGVGLIYLILGTQFLSYFQPLLILATIPMAFTGVVLGLLVTGNPLSLYTLYGMVALAGIAVNAAIVLISAANTRLAAGMSPLHATLYAARRRVIPILITTLTTIAGLFSLATGLAGHSLIWGPVATAVVWGLGFSALLTLFVVPLLYRLFMGRRISPREPG